VRVAVKRRAGIIMEAVRRLDGAGVVAEDVAVRRPTLDDVFLSLTGHDTGQADDEPADAESEEVAA
jgi:ABC-2 type transport system ATP-binding protein